MLTAIAPHDIRVQIANNDASDDATIGRLSRRDHLLPYREKHNTSAISNPLSDFRGLHKLKAECL
jgi:hypothetical protein